MFRGLFRFLRQPSTPKRYTGNQLLDVNPLDTSVSGVSRGVDCSALELICVKGHYVNTGIVTNGIVERVYVPTGVRASLDIARGVFLLRAHSKIMPYYESNPKIIARYVSYKGDHIYGYWLDASSIDGRIDVSGLYGVIDMKGKVS